MGSPAFQSRRPTRGAGGVCAWPIWHAVFAMFSVLFGRVLSRWFRSLVRWLVRSLDQSLFDRCSVAIPPRPQIQLELKEEAAKFGEVVQLLVPRGAAPKSTIGKVSGLF